MGTAVDSQRTRMALIRAAGQLFAEHGPAEVSVRQIVAKAGVNLSALNYHFGDRQSLYREVLVHACTYESQDNPWAELEARVPSLSPRAALEKAVMASLQDYSPQRLDWRIRLIERECLDPSPAFREVLRHKWKPDFRLLCEIVARAADSSADDPGVKFGVIAMYTMVSTFMVRRRMISDLAPDVVRIVVDEQRMVPLLCDLTLDAVKRFGRAGTASPK